MTAPHFSVSLFFLLLFSSFIVIILICFSLVIILLFFYFLAFSFFPLFFLLPLSAFASILVHWLIFASGFGLVTITSLRSLLLTSPSPPFFLYSLSLLPFLFLLPLFLRFPRLYSIVFTLFLYLSTALLTIHSSYYSPVYASRYLLPPVFPLLLLCYTCIPCGHLFPIFQLRYCFCDASSPGCILRNTALLRNAPHR